jgi:hypothetical protein
MCIYSLVTVRIVSHPHCLDLLRFERSGKGMRWRRCNRMCCSWSKRDHMVLQYRNGRASGPEGSGLTKRASNEMVDELLVVSKEGCGGGLPDGPTYQLKPRFNPTCPYSDQYFQRVWSRIVLKAEEGFAHLPERATDKKDIDHSQYKSTLLLSSIAIRRK